MKYSIACLAAIAIASSAFAVTPATSAAVTIALTASEETGGFKVVADGETTYEYDKYSSKENADGETLSEIREYKSVVNVTRVGNAQILAALNLEDLLDGSVKGWSIQSYSLVSDDESGDDSDTGPSFYAVKAGLQPVEINMSIIDIAGVSAESSKYTIDYVKEKETYVASGSDKLTVNFELADFSVQGVATVPYKYVSGSLGKGADAESYKTYLSGAVKLAAISGTFGDYSVAEGSLSIAAAKVIDLDLVFSP